MKSSQEIRREFLDFFKSKGHTIIPSAPVIPHDDPTLLFTNAGMNQFKDVFLGRGTRAYTRCANTQKCIRVSGKHNDLEEVGHDGYHHTFFEMLGNWSFGDYYKEEAIRWAWELLTEKWGIPKYRLWATVFADDNESFELWKKVTDINPAHVLKFGAKDNFWEMADTGPCGPCSEIHIDLTREGCKPGDINSGNPEVMEFWNLVFIQYDRDERGVLHPLPKRHVDTGMGFERMVRILQNKNSDYETDVFLPLIDELIHITGKDYTGEQVQSSMNVIADHIRSLTFAIADGAVPSNEGRGYVLRRILRRAARYGRNLGMHQPFMFRLVDVVTQTMGSVFPEIEEKKEFIKEVVKGEEEGFNETLDRGIVFFDEEIGKMQKENRKTFSGEVAFKLHDTYGFPIDLTQLMAKEIGFEVDTFEFDELMAEQKERARAARKQTIGIEISAHTIGGRYNPYLNVDAGIETKITGCSLSPQPYLVLETNPFYQESGGQVSDTGQISVNGDTYDVADSRNGIVVLSSLNRPIKLGSKVTVVINRDRRHSIERNHTATHIVHEALRQVLGGHVKQMGSYLDDKFLRFDFPHFHKLKPNEIKAIEDIVNDKIKQNIGTYWEILPYNLANKIPGVKKLFGEKYGDRVRVVFVDESFSVEFCGGTHVKETGDIGLFKIVKEESVSSGVRRIFARTGQGIVDYINERIAVIEDIVSTLPENYSKHFESGIENLKRDLPGTGFRDIEFLKTLLEYQGSILPQLLELRDKYTEERKHLEKQLARENVKQAASSLDDIVANAQTLDGIKLVSRKFEIEGMDELKEIGDVLRAKIKTGVGLLYAVVGDKINLCAVVTDDLTKKLNAGKIVGQLGKFLGGGGGGRPHLATAGGKDISKLDEALRRLPEIVKKYLEE